MINDILNDIADHTTDLSVFTIAKICALDDSIRVFSMSPDNQLFVDGSSMEPVEEIHGVFGIADLKQFTNIIRNKEYKEGANIYIEDDLRGNVITPSYIMFNNATNDFQNSVRLMGEDQINKKLPDIDTKVDLVHDVSFVPDDDGINRFKSQMSLSSNENTFVATTEDGNLVFQFGSISTIAGKIIFARDVEGELKVKRQYPCAYLKSILALKGEKVIQFSDQGLIQVQVKTDLMEYTYTVSATR